MRVIALVSCTIDSVPYSTAIQVTRQSTLEMIPASSVPPTELASCVVPAWTILAWQLDLLGALNVPTVITWHSCLPLLLLVSSLHVFFILALNLTATQGLINGVIFYANIVWAYKIILSHRCWSRSFIHISSSFYCLAQLGFWNRDLLLCWTGCLLEDMATVSIPILHLGHCWCYHCCLPLLLSPHLPHW